MSLPRPEHSGPVDYDGAIAPSWYHCGQCGASGVKLWREYQTFLNHQSLLCAKCTCAEQGVAWSYSVRALDSGKVAVTARVTEADVQCHDVIGWRVPAVPTEDGSTYWGYSSVSEDACKWWYRLPLVPE